MSSNRRSGMGGSPAAKPKDFKKSVKRIFIELGIFKYFILLAVLLSVLSSVISIFAPKQLSKLTDEITSGLMINNSNLVKISNSIKSNINSDSFKKRIVKILDINYTNFGNIMTDSSISQEEQSYILKLYKGDFSSIYSLSDNTLNKLFTDSIYNGVNISRSDKIKFIKESINNRISLPDSIAKVIFDDLIIDGVKINSYDQVKFMNMVSSSKELKKDKDIYNKFDKLPSSLKKVILPSMRLDKIKSIMIFIFILYVVSALLSFLEHIIMANTSNRFAYKIRNNISKKFNKLPLSFFDKNETGNIMSIVTNDVDTITQSLNQSAAMLVSSSTLLIGSLVMMFITNIVMAFTAVISSIFGFIFIGIILSKSQKYFIKKQESLGLLNGHIEEMYSSLNVINVYNASDYASDKFNKLNTELYKSNILSSFLSGLMQPGMNFIGNFGYVAVCIVGSMLALDGKITFGVIVAFITYVRLFTQPLSQFAQGLNSLQSGVAASERVFKFIDEKEEADESSINSKLAISKAKGNIEFKNVVFTYDGNDTPTIKGFSASIKAGQKVAIVGPTGAGKTTMVNLLMKFYNISSGDIVIDNYSISKLTRDNIHDLFTMVLQDTWLFEGSIKDNIRYNQLDVSDDEIVKVCEVVGLDHYIKTLPKGYDTYINSVDSVSAGERQLMTIARGMLKKSPFLILDEATSNVDTRTEEIVQKAMDKLIKNKTSFIIAHRLSTIKNADLILVVKDGNIVEQGNHEELMKLGGSYAELYNSQFELE